MLTKHRSKFVWSSLLAIFAVSAAAAAPAQAVPDWLVETSPGVHELVVNTNKLPIALEKDVMGALVTKVGLAKVEILCEEEEVTEGLLEGEGKAQGTLEYKQCTTKLNGTAAAKCKPAEPIKAPFKAELFAREEEGYVLVLPATGSAFTTFSLGAECAIGNSIELTGSAVLRDCADDLRVAALRHLIELGAGDANHSSALLFGGNPATLTGSTWVKLKNDKPWKAMVLNVL